MNNANDLTLKLLLLGDSGCGKTCILLRYCNQVFSVSHLSTIGIDFKVKTVMHENKLIKLQIWDTAGQERFRTITSSYFRGSHAVLIVYDITDRKSFANVSYWIDSITKSNPDIVKILVGNKSDAVNERYVSYQEGVELSKKYNMPFFETSAKNGQNINETFTKLIDIAVKTYLNNNIKDNIIIGPEHKPKISKPNKCC